MRKAKNNCVSERLPGGWERGPLPPPAAATAPPGDDVAESVVDPDVELPASSSRSRSPRVGLTKTVQYLENCSGFPAGLNDKKIRVLRRAIYK